MGAADVQTAHRQENIVGSFMDTIVVVPETGDGKVGSRCIKVGIFLSGTLATIGRIETAMSVNIG